MDASREQHGGDGRENCDEVAEAERPRDGGGAAAAHEQDRGDAAIADSAPWADQIVCAWGTHGAHLDRGPQVERLLRATGLPLYHLGLSKHGHPKHPLYIGYAVQPELWVD